MRKPAEHGNVATSIVLGVFSIVYAIVSRRYYESVIFWLPIFLGLFEYDVPFRTAIRKKEDATMIAVIFLLSVISLYYEYYLIIPYTLFFAVYSLRLRIVKNKLNRYANAMGLIAFSLMFSLTAVRQVNASLILASTLSVYFIGSEFAVRGKVRRKNVLVLYNLIPPFMGLINPYFFIYSLSLARIPVSLFSKSVRQVGVAETSSMIILVVFLILSIHFGLLPPKKVWLF
ncbi:MAG: hypothetical protein QXU18_14375 [Thermoplasmatales archaeon]